MSEVEKALACAQGLGEKSEEIVAAEQVQDSYHEALQAASTCFFMDEGDVPRANPVGP